MSELVAPPLRFLFVATLCCDSRRDLSRHVATSRGRSHLLDIGDVLCDRCRRDQILFAEGRLHAAAVEMAFCAIALDAAIGAGMAGVLVALGRLVDREGIFAVGAGRDRSRQVGRSLL